MVTGTFDKIGDGSRDNPFRPDFSGLGYSPTRWTVLEEFASSFSVYYRSQ